ncbi:putative E3 ubiquitin-protein ligase lin [Phtheirospermum japonicum]|uniref:Putative E3 ubiquitin-protein ligase lin n=1 Tax=Phtheirospermum japonicum TaxID=374723 RepID=A0A830DC18_9LAMI|nr:putative E3 ubiquitin-protein ligase lin [Phtheirospermum japonicum]
MASLHKLLSEEGLFEQRQISQKPKKKLKFKTRQQKDSVALPIFICHDRRSFEKAPSLKGSSVISSRRGGGGGGSGSERSIPKPKTPRKDEPAAIDDVAIKAMVSILSGYVGRYSKDENFRKNIREKCHLCLENMKKNSDNEILAHLKMGIESVEKLTEIQELKKEMDLESLTKSIKIFKIVSSLNDPHSHLSACSHLYLSIVYKIAKNDKIAARQLLKLFSDSPFLARTHLLPELWDHVFLPHLLHIKIWHEKELGLLAGSGYADKEKMVKALKGQYDYHMDIGTTKFALYYKEWLKFGGQAPSIPSVPLPSKSSYSRSRRKSSDSSTSLYRTVFGPIRLKGRSMDLDNGNGGLDNVWDLDDEKHYNHVEKKFGSRRRSSSSSQSYYRAQKPELWPDIQKSDYFRFLGCRAEPTESTIHASYISNNEKIKNDQNTQLSHSNDTTRAVATICSSESLSDCEKAIRTITDAWINSHGDEIIETSLSQASSIQGIIEVLYVSTNDEILELAISLLAELATKSEINRLRILNSDPQLEISIRLLRSGSLFLKAAALLYLIKPKAKQMVSMEWIALVLRVLEFGDQSQTLFMVKCCPHEAAYYFLDELLTGFDEDKNFENARQIVSLGGLSLLVRRMDEGDICEKSKAAGVLRCCVKADRSCRYYLAKNLKKETIMSLLAHGAKENSYEHALALLTELLCLSRRSQIIECLTGLKKGWDCINTMHSLLLLLNKARPEERPIIAVILLQLDLMEDTIEYSVYREEAIDAIIRSLDRWALDEKTQELSTRALLILGGHFSYIGEPEVEKWLLRKAGLDETNVKNSLCGKDITIDGRLNLSEDEKITEIWVSKTATVLLISGNKRLFLALSDSIANSIPCLARASLVTVCWMKH